MLTAMGGDAAGQSRAHAIGLAAAAAISVPVGLIGWIALPTPITASHPSSLLALGTLLPLISFLAGAMLLVDPLVDRSVAANVPALRHASNAWTIAIGAAAFVGLTAFERTPHFADLLVAAVAYYGVSRLACDRSASPAQPSCTSLNRIRVSSPRCTVR